jgi:hypothetical protein
LVHVNATATGGGVAELLHGLVPAQAAYGLPVGWAVIADNVIVVEIRAAITAEVDGLWMRTG